MTNDLTAEQEEERIRLATEQLFGIKVPKPVPIPSGSGSSPPAEPTEDDARDAAFMRQYGRRL